MALQPLLVAFNDNKMKKHIKRILENTPDKIVICTGQSNPYPENNKTSKIETEWESDITTPEQEKQYEENFKRFIKEVENKSNCS